MGADWPLVSGPSLIENGRGVREGEEEEEGGGQGLTWGLTMSHPYQDFPPNCERVRVVLRRCRGERKGGEAGEQKTAVLFIPRSADRIGRGVIGNLTSRLARLVADYLHGLVIRLKDIRDECGRSEGRFQAEYYHG